MDPEMMAMMMQQGGGAPAPMPEQAMPGGGMPMPMPPPVEDVTGPMAAPEAIMQAGGDSIAALLEYVDDPDVIELLRKQDEERQMLLSQIDDESNMAAQALLDRLRMFGESVDQPGGPVMGMN